MGRDHLPWKQVWRNSVPTKVVFSVLHHGWEGTLPIPQLVHMFKKAKELLDYLLLHCEVALDLDW